MLSRAVSLGAVVALAWLPAVVPQPKPVVNCYCECNGGLGACQKPVPEQCCCCNPSGTGECFGCSWFMEEGFYKPVIPFKGATNAYHDCDNKCNYAQEVDPTLKSFRSRLISATSCCMMYTAQKGKCFSSFDDFGDSTDTCSNKLNCPLRGCKMPLTYEDVPLGHEKVGKEIRPDTCLRTCGGSPSRTPLWKNYDNTEYPYDAAGHKGMPGGAPPMDPKKNPRPTGMPPPKGLPRLQLSVAHTAHDGVEYAEYVMRANDTLASVATHVGLNLSFVQRVNSGVTYYWEEELAEGSTLLLPIAAMEQALQRGQASSIQSTPVVASASASASASTSALQPDAQPDGVVAAAVAAAANETQSPPPAH